MDANDRNLDPNDATTRRRALVVEVMGPALAGKTSLVRRCAPVMIGSGPASTCRGSGGSPSRGGQGGRPAPPRGSSTTGGTAGSWNEMKSMAFLDAWPEQRGDSGPPPPSPPCSTTVRSTGWRAFASSDRPHRGERFQRWWRASLEGWLGALDLVVSLEAPDATLLGRAKERGALVPERRPSRRGERRSSSPASAGVRPDARGGDGGHAQDPARPFGSARPTRSRTRYRPRWGLRREDPRQETHR